MRIPTAAAPAGLGRFVDLRVTLAAAALASSLSFSAPALAVGPENIALSVKSYEEVTCPETLAQGRAGGSLGAGASIGIAQKCVQVKAAAENNSDKAHTLGRSEAAARSTGTSQKNLFLGAHYQQSVICPHHRVRAS